MNNLKTLSEVGRLIGIPAHRIVYAHHTGAVPEPARVCGRRAYGEGDIEILATFFGTEIPEEDRVPRYKLLTPNSGR